MDRRVYDRVCRTIPCILYFPMSERTYTETDAEIINICESGIALITDYKEEIEKDIFKGATLTFELVDNYTYMGKETIDVLLEESVIKWVKREDDKLNVGCKIIKPTIAWEEYIKKQKVNIFIARGFKTTNTHLLSLLGGTV